MKPKKKKDILIETFKKELPFNDELIKDVIDFYWKEGVYKDIENLTHFSLYVPKLGTYKIIRKNMSYLLDKFNKNKDERIQYKKEKVERIYNLLQEDYKRLNELRESKINFYKNLEE